jgi:hypothetical protein
MTTWNHMCLRARTRAVDFSSEAEYGEFVKNLLAQRNAGRRQRRGA